MGTSTGSVQQRFADALARLIEQVREDRSVLAAILCGSLSHDTVWAKSDIDLALVTIDDKKVERASLALNIDGINVHAFLIPRAEFRKMVEGSVRNSFMHSMLAKSRLLYTHDDTIADLCARLNELGARDMQVQLLAAGASALLPIDKAHKWLVTRGDLNYSALWILYAATPLARIEVIGEHLLADREVIPQAMALNPAFFQVIYADLLNTKKTRKNVQAALDAIDSYMAKRAPELFGLVIDHLREVGDTRSATDLDAHFKRNFNIECVSGACEYLADQGLLGKVSAPVQLTRRSNVLVEEQAFIYLGDREDEY